MNFREQIELSAKDNASSVIRGVMGNLRGLIGQMAGLAGAGIGLGALVKQGVEFNKTMEDSRGGIAGVLLMTREYVDATGQVVTGQKAMDAAFAESSVIQEKLKEDALKTAASYTELVGAFQTALAPAAAAGVKNLDDVREITVMATQAMAALNIPTVQAAQELRGLFSGDMGPDNRLNQILRVSKDDLKALGGDAEKIAAFFKEKLAPAASAAAMQTGTLTVRLSNLGDIVDQVMGNATSGLFRELSEGVADVIKWVEEIGPAAQTAGDSLLSSFKAAVGPIEEVGRSLFDAWDTKVRESGGTWAEVFQGMAIVFNNVMGHVRAGWVVVVNAFIHPLDTIRLVFGNLLGNILEMLAAVAEKFPKFMGGDQWADTLRSAASAVDEWGLKNSKFLAGVEVGLARTEAAWEANEKAIVGAGQATSKLSDTTSRAKSAAEDAAGAAHGFGTVWATESAKASAALNKFLGGFAAFTGDVVGEATAKIEEEYRDLVGQLGQMMFQAKVPFEKGLAMLEELARAKGKKITETVFNGDAAVEEFIGVLERKREVWQKAIEDIFKFHPDDTKEGAKAGLFGVFAALPTAAESAANAVQDVWGSMARSFDDAFFSVLTGKLDSLKDVFKNLWESILQTASRYFSDLLQRWLATQMQMGQPAPGSYPGVGAAGSAGESGWGSAGAYLGAGVAGFGIGGMVGQGGAGNQWGGALGAVGGLALGSTATAVGLGVSAGMTGAMAGSVVPIIGTIVGAILGAVIGGIFNKNSERSVTGSLGEMVGATSWENRPIYARGGREPFGVGDEYDPGEPIGYEWVGTLQKPSTSFEREGQRVFQGQAATLADIFRTGAEDQAGELLAAYQKALKDSLSGAWFKIAAGSEEDIQKDAEILMTRLLPRIGLSAAFGQTGYLPHGDRDAAGGIPGINWGMPGMDESGAWTGAKQLFDPEAPIPKMLAGLGFTEAKISELAGRISTDDPEKLLAYIQGIVGIVVEVNRLTGEMGKSFEELAATWDAEAAAGPAAAFGKQAQEIADAFDALDLYSGDEQIAKAQEAIGLSDQFWQSVEAYLRQLQASVEKMSASLQSQRQTMRDFLNPVGPDETAANAWGSVPGVWGKLANATDPAEVEKAVAEAQAAIDKVFSVMAERINRGKALIEKLTGLSDRISSMREDLAFDELLRTDPLRAWGKQMTDIQTQIADASRMSGLAQIEALEQVGATAEQVFAGIEQFLADIASTSANINKSIEQQKWELQTGELDAPGQASAITQRIHDLQEQLKVATSPAEIQAIISEIQSLTNRYVGTFGKDDPKRQEAIDWATEQLDRANGLAQETLGVLGAQAEAFADELETMLGGAVDTITDNINDAATTIGQLSHTLGELDRVMRETMENLGDGILDSLEPLRVAMDGAADIFKNATDTATNALTEPEVGLADAADRSSSRLDAFSAALDRAITKANAFADSGSEGTGDGSGRPPARSGNTPTTATIIATNRRYARYMAPRVA